MAKQKHGVPLLLSIFVPGLGQMVKKHFIRGLFYFFSIGLLIVYWNESLFTTILITLLYLLNLVSAYNS